MKSRTSFFNFPAFRKDLTRFAPAWGLYSVGLLLMFTVLMAENNAYYRANNLVERIVFMAVINFCYGILSAQLLFGDLCSTRMCNALHAMPLKREGWFLTHLTAGLCFALIPYGAVTVFAMPMLKWNWLMGAAWLLGTMLEYLFFFSVAVLCCFCTGNRFATGVFYGLVNFLALVVMFFVQEVYGPLLSGITIQIPWIEELTPLVNLMIPDDWDCWFDKHLRAEYGIGQSWTYLFVLTALVPGLLAGALGLYKKRRLECAGEFVVVKSVGPVFLIIYALTVAVLFQLVVGYSSLDVSFFVGLAVGWFTGLMLIKRTVRVFRGKTVLGYVVFAAVMLITGSNKSVYDLRTLQPPENMV